MKIEFNPIELLSVWTNAFKTLTWPVSVIDLRSGVILGDTG